MAYYQSEEEVEVVVRGFESCSAGRDEFKHNSHLTVAVWYLSHSTELEALDQMRSGLFRFLDHHGVGREKYNETLTIFWIRLVQSVMYGVQPETSFLKLTNAVLERLADPRVVFEYYTEACLKSERAKTGWVEPDLKNL